MSIKFDKRNYRKHSDSNKRKIKKSLQECGAGRSVLVDADDCLIAGNGVYEQASALGIPTRVIETDGTELVVVKRTDLQTDDDKRKLLALADNATSDAVEWDFDNIGLDTDVLNVGEWDIVVPDIDADNSEVKEDDFNEETDTIPVVCKNGDIWQLGNHRLMCGDSTSESAFAALMDGQTADICFTSPPYNAGFGSNLTKDNGRSKYTNGDDDNRTRNQYTEFLDAFLSNTMKYAKYTFCNIQMLANNKLSMFDILIKNINKLGDIIIWDKTRAQPQLAERVLNSQFEFVFCFHEKGNRAIGTKYFHGTLSNIISISPTRNEYAEIHNAVFPIELPTHFISNFSTESVLDPFGGTGTTLIAAEQLGRKCYMMELDPHYCDVIIARWEKLTGQKAIKL